MNNIEQHISRLLLSNDCVIIPDFGGFITHYTEACYSEEQNMFLPPRREVGFNSNLTMNDSLLVQDFVETYDISYPEALRRIEKNVEELRQCLNTVGCYVFNGIGTISRNEDGQYTFKPFAAGIITPDYYALSAFEIKQIEAKEETGLTSEDYEIVADENGKPKIRLLSRENVKTGTGNETVDESSQEIHVSLSHSADYAAAIVADSPVGIDIEEKSDRNFMVTKRMYSEVEKDRVFNSANPDKEFQVIWTEKEAYLKCTGEGISVPLKSFYKDSESGEILRLPKTSDSNEEGDKYLQTGLFISSVMTDNPDYSISVCKDEKLALDIQRVSEL